MFLTQIVCQSAALAQIGGGISFGLPPVGTFIEPTRAFMPVMIKGLQIHPSEPLAFSFILDVGEEDLNAQQLQTESTKLIKYFLAALTVPEDHMWVNLSPTEKDRIIGEGFAQTEMGRDVLAQDYLLKQLTASFIHPETTLGAKFWQEVNAKVLEKNVDVTISADVLSKVWIVPDKATVYEHDNGAYVVERHLKVMMDEEYGLLGKTGAMKSETLHKEATHATTDVIRSILLPAIEQEVNFGAHFANLRQVYNSMILATWYKKKFNESLLGKIYADQSKVEGVEHGDEQVNQQIYDQYLAAFKQGVFDLIKEEYDPATQSIIPKKYFSGGVMAVDSALLAVIPQGRALDQTMIAEAFGGEQHLKYDVNLLELTESGDNRAMANYANIPLNDRAMTSDGRNDEQQTEEEEMTEAFSQALRDLILWYCGKKKADRFSFISHFYFDKYFKGEDVSRKAETLKNTISQMFAFSGRDAGKTSFYYSDLGEDESFYRALFETALNMERRDPVLDERVNGILVEDILRIILQGEQEVVSSIVNNIEILQAWSEGIAISTVYSMDQKISKQLDVLEQVNVESYVFDRNNIRAFREDLLSAVIVVPGIAQKKLNQIYDKAKDLVNQRIQDERDGKASVFDHFTLLSEIRDENVVLKDENQRIVRNVSLDIPYEIREKLEQKDIDRKKNELLNLVYRRLDQRKKEVREGHREPETSQEMLAYAKKQLQHDDYSKDSLWELIEAGAIDEYLNRRVQIRNAFGYNLRPNERLEYYRMINFLSVMDEHAERLLFQSHLIKDIKDGLEADNAKVCMVTIVGVEEGYTTSVGKSLYYSVTYDGVEGKVPRFNGPEGVRNMHKLIGQTFPAIVTDFQMQSGFPMVTFDISMGQGLLKEAEFKTAQQEQEGIVDVKVLEVIRMHNGLEANALNVQWVSPTGQTYVEFVPSDFIPEVMRQGDSLQGVQGKTLQARISWNKNLGKGDFKIIEQLTPELQVLYSEIESAFENNLSLSERAKVIAIAKDRQGKPSGLKLLYKGVVKGFIYGHFMQEDFLFSAIPLEDLEERFLDKEYKVEVEHYDPNDLLGVRFRARDYEKRAYRRMKAKLNQRDGKSSQKVVKSKKETYKSPTMGDLLIAAANKAHEDKAMLTRLTQEYDVEIWDALHYVLNDVLFFFAGGESSGLSLKMELQLTEYFQGDATDKRALKLKALMNELIYGAHYKTDKKASFSLEQMSLDMEFVQRAFDIANKVKHPVLDEKIGKLPVKDILAFMHMSQEQQSRQFKEWFEGLKQNNADIEMVEFYDEQISQWLEVLRNIKMQSALVDSQFIEKTRKALLLEVLKTPGMLKVKFDQAFQKAEDAILSNIHKERTRILPGYILYTMLLDLKSNRVALLNDENKEIEQTYMRVDEIILSQLEKGELRHKKQSLIALIEDRLLAREEMIFLGDLKPKYWKQSYELVIKQLKESPMYQSENLLDLINFGKIDQYVLRRSEILSAFGYNLRERQQYLYNKETLFLEALDARVRAMGFSVDHINDNEDVKLSTVEDLIEDGSEDQAMVSNVATLIKPNQQILNAADDLFSKLILWFCGKDSGSLFKEGSKVIQLDQLFFAEADNPSKQVELLLQFFGQAIGSVDKVVDRLSDNSLSIDLLMRSDDFYKVLFESAIKINHPVLDKDVSGVLVRHIITFVMKGDVANREEFKVDFQVLRSSRNLEEVDVLDQKISRKLKILSKLKVRSELINPQLILNTRKKLNNIVFKIPGMEKKRLDRLFENVVDAIRQNIYFEKSGVVSADILFTMLKHLKKNEIIVVDESGEVSEPVSIEVPAYLKEKVRHSEIDLWQKKLRELIISRLEDREDAVAQGQLEPALNGEFLIYAQYRLRDPMYQEKALRVLINAEEINEYVIRREAIKNAFDISLDKNEMQIYSQSILFLDALDELADLNAYENVAQKILDQIFDRATDAVNQTIELEKQGILSFKDLFSVLKQIKETDEVVLRDNSGGYIEAVSMNVPESLQMRLGLDAVEIEKSRLRGLILDRLDERRAEVAEGRREPEMSEEVLIFVKQKLAQGPYQESTLLELLNSGSIGEYLKLRSQIKGVFGYSLGREETNKYINLISFLDDLDQKAKEYIEDSNVMKALRREQGLNSNIFMVEVRDVLIEKKGEYKQIFYKVEYEGVDGLATIILKSGEKPHEMIGKELPAFVDSINDRGFPVVRFDINSARKELRRREFRSASKNKDEVNIEIIEVLTLGGGDGPANALKAKWISPSGQEYVEFVPPHHIPFLMKNNNKLSTYVGQKVMAYVMWLDVLKNKKDVGSFQIIKSRLEERQSLLAGLLNKDKDDESFYVTAVRIDKNRNGVVVMYENQIEGFIEGHLLDNDFQHQSEKILSERYVDRKLKVKVLDLNLDDPSALRFFPLVERRDQAMINSLEQRLLERNKERLFGSELLDDRAMLIKEANADAAMAADFDRLVSNLIRWYCGEKTRKIFRGSDDDYIYLDKEYDAVGGDGKAKELIDLLVENFPDFGNVRYGDARLSREALRNNEAFYLALFKKAQDMNHRVLVDEINGMRINSIIEIIKQGSETLQQKFILDMARVEAKTERLNVVDALDQENLTILQVLADVHVDEQMNNLPHWFGDNWNKLVLETPNMPNRRLLRIFKKAEEAILQNIENEKKGDLTFRDLIAMLNEIKTGKQITVKKGRAKIRVVNFEVSEEVASTLPKDSIQYQKEKLFNLVSKRFKERANLVSAGHHKEIEPLSSSESFQYAQMQLKVAKYTEAALSTLINYESIDEYLLRRAEIKNSFYYQMIAPEKAEYTKMISFLDALDLRAKEFIRDSQDFVELERNQGVDEKFMVKIVGVTKYKNKKSLYYNIVYNGIEGVVSDNETPFRKPHLEIGKEYPAYVKRAQIKDGWPDVELSMNKAIYDLRALEFQEASKFGTKVKLDINFAFVKDYKQGSADSLNVTWTAPSGQQYTKNIFPELIPDFMKGDGGLEVYVGKKMSAWVTWGAEQGLGNFDIIDEQKEGVKNDQAMTANYGGIDLNSSHLDLQIKRDGAGMVLPMDQQDISHMNIKGFAPVIVNVVPVYNLPTVLGVNVLP